MAYLEQFSRKKKQQGESTVLTARLPSKLYDDLKKYTDELGLSISEAVNLLVEREIREWKTKNEATENTARIKETSNDDGSSEFVLKQFDTVKRNTTKRQANTSSNFSTKQWEVDGQLACPLCKGWYSASNFTRHLKTQHDPKLERKDVFTNQKHLAIVNDMIQERTGTPIK